MTLAASAFLLGISPPFMQSTVSHSSGFIEVGLYFQNCENDHLHIFSGGKIFLVSDVF